MYKQGEQEVEAKLLGSSSQLIAYLFLFNLFTFLV
jgi:hypothetical protein